MGKFKPAANRCIIGMEARDRFNLVDGDPGMPPFLPSLAAALALAVPATFAVPASADSGEVIGMIRAVAIVEQRYKGQVMEVDLDQRGSGRLVYEIDIASGNSLREVEIDARTGTILGSSPQRAEALLRRVFGRGLPANGRTRPLSASLRDLEERTGGTVIDVDFEVEGGQPRYEVELATQAGIAGIYLDPETGRRLAFVVDD